MAGSYGLLLLGSCWPVCGAGSYRLLCPAGLGDWGHGDWGHALGARSAPRLFLDVFYLKYKGNTNKIWRAKRAGGFFATGPSGTSGPSGSYGLLLPEACVDQRCRGLLRTTTPAGPETTGTGAPPGEVTSCFLPCVYIYTAEKPE